MYKFQPVLELLRNISTEKFQEAFGDDYGNIKGISYHSFVFLIKSKLNLEPKDCDVKHLFCQIDRYSKGRVTSMELNDYLKEYEKKRMLPPEGPFERTPALYTGARCQDSIIDWVLYTGAPGVQDEVAGHYFAVSRTGNLSVWTKEIKKRFETTIETSDDGVAGLTTTWATSLTCLPKAKLLAVSTTSGNIKFFRTSIYRFEHRFSIMCFPYIVLRLNCYDSEKLVCGDFSGRVFIIHIDKSFFERNRRKAAHLPPEKFVFESVKYGKVAGLAYEGINKMHLCPVQKVEYIPSLNAVISCAGCTKGAMMIHFLENNESLSFTSADGINCFAYCKRLNCVVTGGTDHAIKIWNPIINKSCNESLIGHSSPVNHVLVVEDRLLLISTDLDKTLRVWDLLRPSCLQIIKFKESEFPGKQSFSSCFLDPATGNLILTTYRIGKLEPLRPIFREKTHPCSEYIVLAAYSSVYNCLVTVGNSSVIAVWDGESGALIYEYENSHQLLDSDGLPRNMSVLAAGLDTSERRVVTADRIGRIKVWNFHLGLCLQSFKINCTILSLSFVGFHIYASGSSGEVVDCYDNGLDYVEPVTWEKRHQKTVVSIDYYRRNLVASASGDGEIIIWHRKSTDVKIQLKDLKEEDEKSIKVDKDYLAKAEVDRRKICSISQILFLQKREMDFFVGNLVSCGMDGRIRFWNIVCTNKQNEGKLLSKFQAVFRKCDGILCMATDTENRYLISGDTMGYVKVYELDSYYSSYGSAPPRTGEPSLQQLAKFPFLRLRKLVLSKELDKSRYYTTSELGFCPFLLNSFRAHLGAVLKVDYVSERDTLITAGRDSSVRLWSITGVYIGRLGPSEGFQLSIKDNEKNQKHRMPPDLKSTASALTLFVMNDGTMPHWIRAIEALRGCRFGHQPEGFTEKPLPWNLGKSVSLEDLSDQRGALEEELSQRMPYFKGTRACKQRLFDDVNIEA